jgi:hypothetical protein
MKTMYIYQRYQSEQIEIQSKIAVINTTLEQQIDYQASAEQLRAAISDYLNIYTHTPLILNKCIEKIMVRHVETVDGQKQQVITIVWKFAGEM